MMLYKKNATRHYYDTVYGRYKPEESHCLHSIDNLNKARKTVTQVFKAFGLYIPQRGQYNEHLDTIAQFSNHLEAWVL